jgi:hypothetical protein
MLKVPNLRELPPELLDQRRELKAKLKLVEEELECLILEKVGVKIGDVVEVQRNGLQYRVASAHAYISENALSPVSGCFVRGYRLYKTGRRAGSEARTDTHLDVSGCTIVEAK